jgi:beta-glucosidase
VNSLRRASKNILYTVVNSSAMNGISETTKVVNVTPPWQYWLLALDIFVLLLAIAGTILIIRRCRRNRVPNVKVETRPAE